MAKNNQRKKTEANEFLDKSSEDGSESQDVSESESAADSEGEAASEAKPQAESKSEKESAMNEIPGKFRKFQ